MRSSSHRRHARSAHGRLEEPAERIGVRRYDPTYGGRGAVQNQSAGNDGGEPGGTRTRDPMIKSHVLYRLSYGLGPRVCTGGLVLGQ
jgi:hypothetical protein